MSERAVTMDESARTARPLQTDISHASSRSNSSLQRRACRICQSETGEMLRPCGCAGTMGDIHEHCLSTWVTVSQKPNCEICKEDYQRSGEQYKKLRDWSRPAIGQKESANAGLLLSLIFCCVYMVLLFIERKTYERCFENSLPLRSDDLGRILVFVMLVTFLINCFARNYAAACKYFKKQKEIRFVNKRPRI